MYCFARPGSIAGCVLDDVTAFGGFFIVRADWRKRGVGRALWEERLRYLGGRNIGIDAVESRVEFDQENGFKHLSFVVCAFLGCLKPKMLTSHSIADVIFRKLDCGSEADVRNVLEYDTKMHTIKREACFRQWISADVTETLVAYDLSKNVIGYGCVQPIEGGHYMLGPVFAERKDVGRELMVLLSRASGALQDGKQVGLDVPQENVVAMQFAQEHGMKQELKLVRMYSDKIVRGVNVEKIFAFTTMGIALA